jgi:hypothetical protein
MSTRPRLNEFPVVIAPECHAMSDAMVADLKQYVRDGGKLVVERRSDGAV